VALLEESLAIAEQLGDVLLGTDVSGNLGLALLGVQEPTRAIASLEKALAETRIRVDRYAEKLALEKLGIAYGWLGMPTEALTWFEQALRVAQELGDYSHQADLLWQLAIQHAELRQKDQALARGQATVLLLRQRNHPHASWFAGNLSNYRTTNGSTGLPAAPSASKMAGGAGTIISAWDLPSEPATERAQATGSHVLRMAFQAAKSLAHFLMSGLRSVQADVQRQRLRTCAICPHHTGLRCRICGCFTNIKTRMAHESCPLGKWLG
jgi:tetratricopeptide (TPR) repeat protein